MIPEILKGFHPLRSECSEVQRNTDEWYVLSWEQIPLSPADCETWAGWM